MLEILPVVFVLTALIEVWVPRETILKHLGKDAGVKGTIAAFLLGSFSAGPIYAAFPITTTLYRKGASTKNIVIILSTWAVTKVPMLANEAKFLGLKYMAIRWILTSVSIYIMAVLLDRFSTIQLKEKDSSKVSIDESACMGCKVCEKEMPVFFKVEDKKANVLQEIPQPKLQKLEGLCPFNAIKF